MAKTYEMTQEYLDSLKKELEYIKNVEIVENRRAIAEARAQGDLSENADYSTAREEQVRIMNRQQELEEIIKHAIIISNVSSDEVQIGSTVTIYFIDRKEERKFQVVGHLQANPLKQRMSNESPVGRAVLGHKVGDRVKVKSETGKEFEVEIKGIE